MAITLDGTTGITTPGLTNTGTETLVNLTTTGNTTLGDASTDTLNVGNGGLIKDASGNVGVGVTPNAWDSTWTAVDLLYGGSIGAGNYGTRSLHIFDNAYASSAGYKFSGTGYASAYYQVAGEHNWRSTAATGVAGGAASFTTVLSLAGVGKTFALQGGSSNTGVGISFPATQSASSDANTLDDYEEGTWTPSVGGTATYGGDTGGRYVKVGKSVTIWGKIQISSIGTGSTTTISGLPFTAQNSGLEANGASGYYAGTAVNVIAPMSVIDAGTALLRFYSTTTGGTGSGAYVAIFQNGTRIYFTCTYETNA